MRKFISVFAAATLLAVPALADDWGSYSNTRYGAQADVPPGFVPAGPEAANAEGLIFRNLKQHALLTIWGEDFNGAFETHMQKRMAFENSYSGWKIGDKSVTGDWAVFEGSLGSRRMYTRTEIGCRADQTVNIKLEFDAGAGGFDRIINRVARSLKAAC